MVNMHAHVIHRAMRALSVKSKSVTRNVRMDTVTETVRVTTTANVTPTIKELLVLMLVSRINLLFL